MASILTNQSAIVALQTLRSTNQSLAEVQDQISTGRAVANARDNAAIFAISSVIESDIGSFRAINESLSLGQSTVAVGRSAAEQITGLLQETQGLIVSAQEENVDRSQIQTNVSALRDQIVSITNAAQFNSLNLVRGTESVSVLSSLDRAADGSVSASQITVDRQNLEITTGTFDANATAATTLAAPTLASIDGSGTDAAPDTATISFDAALTAAANETFSIDIGGQTITTTSTFSGGEDADAIATDLNAAINAAGITGITASFTAASGGDGPTITLTAAADTADTAVTGVTGTTTTNAGTSDQTNIDGIPPASATSDLVFSGGALAANEGFRVTLTDANNTARNFDFVAREGDTINDVADSLTSQIRAAGIEGISVSFAEATDPSTDNATLTITAAAGTTQDIAIQNTSGGDNVAAGGLAALNSLDVSTAEGAESALAAIEGLLRTSIDAAAAFGSVESRIDIQSEFVTQLTDSLRVGVGALVDADLEEASARLQSLQVQQQLGTQALAIANQAPQSILALFG